MSGRKQHYIPQAVQRAFAAAQTSAKSQVFVFRKGRPAYLTATDGSGAERDFYSNPLTDGDGALDDSITEFEGRHLAPMLRDLRSVRSGPVDAEIASITAVHLAFRTAHIRNALSEIAGDALGQMQSLIVDPRAVRQFTEIDSASGSSAFATQVNEELSKHGLDAWPKTSRSIIERLVMFRVRERFEDLFEPVRELAHQKIGEFRDERVREITKAHARALAKSLVPEERLRSLSSLEWSVVPVTKAGAHFILPDCVVAGRTSANINFQPFAMLTIEASSMVVMPLSATQLLVGSKTATEVDLNTVNEELARCSHEFFISSVRDDNAVQLAEFIGSFSRECYINLLDDAPLAGQYHDAVPDAQLRLPRIRVPTGKFGEEAHKILRSLMRSEIDPDVTAFVGSIVVTSNIQTELGSMLKRVPSAQESRDALAGAVLPIKLQTTWSAHILLPRQLLEVRIRAGDPAKRSLAARLIKQQYGRANYYCWWARQSPDIFEEKLDAEWKLLIRNLVIKSAAEYFASLTLRRQAEDAQFIALAVYELAPRISAAFEMMERIRGDYFVHSDVTRVVREAIEPLASILISCASIAGQLEALDMSLDPESTAGQLLAHRGLWNWYELYVDDLVRHHNMRYDWTAATALGLLPTHVERLLWTIGVFVSPTEGDFWVDVLDDAQFALVRKTLSS